MGMFDTVHATCPNCSSEMDEQTKYGPCLLNDYHVEDMMDKEDAMMVDGMHIRCANCNSSFRIEVDVPDRLPVRLRKLKEIDEDDL